MKKIFKYSMIFKLLFGLFVLSITYNLNAQNYEFDDFWQFKNEKLAYFDSLNVANDGEMKGTGYTQFMRWLYYWQEAVYNDGGFDITVTAKYEKYLSMINETDDGFSSINVEWNELGPIHPPDDKYSANYNRYYRNKGTGRCYFIEFDPQDPNKIFTGSPTGGLFYSTDGGDSWINGGTDFLPNPGIAHMQVNPQNSNAWFITTGEGDGYGNFSFSYGIFRTVDQGQNWEAINEGLNIPDLTTEWWKNFSRKLLIDPNNGNKLFVVFNTGIYKTENSMADANTVVWDLKQEGYFQDIQFKPNSNSQILYASGESIYISENAGNTWTVIPNIEQVDIPYDATVTIRVTPANPDVLYAAVITKDLNNIARLYKYSYNTQTWGPGYVIFHIIPEQQGYGLGRKQAIAVSPFDEDVIIRSNVQYIYRSNDGGQVWHIASDDKHDDSHWFTFGANSNTIWVGTDGGINKSIDGGYTWENKTNNIGVANMHNIGSGKRLSGLILYGGYDTGTSLFEEDDNEWYQLPKTGDSWECAIDDSDLNSPPILYFTTQGSTLEGNGYYRSLDGGYSATGLPIPSDIGHLGWEKSFVKDYSTQSILYVPGMRRVGRSFDKGDNWEAISPDAQAGGNTDRLWYGVWNSITNPDYLYAHRAGEPEPHRLFVSSNCSANPSSSVSWTDITPVYNGQIYENWIGDLAVNEREPDNVWVSYKGYHDNHPKILYYDNSQWIDMSGGENGPLDGLSVISIAYQIGDNNLVYIGTNAGVFYRCDDNPIWTKMEGIPNAQVSDLEINYCANKLRAATFGRGLWETDLLDSPSDITITEDETWIDNSPIAKNIIIPPNITLTITGIVELINGSRIIIEPGGKLILDEGTLTSACDGLWLGIEVWGDANQHQYTIDGYCAQGQLILKNGAVIENAYFGVVLGASGPNMWDPTKAGGIIQVIGNNSMTDPSTSFINNAFAVTFLEYENFHPVYTSVARPNISYLNNAIFEVNDNYHFFGQDKWDKTHVVLYGVSGVDFRGCTFTNESSFTNEGTGINCAPGPAKWLSCGFRVSSICTSQINPCAEESLDKCQFNNLEYGIKTSNTGINTITVKDAVFDNNSYGIHMINTNNASVLFSEFYIGSASDNDIEGCSSLSSGYGIYMDNCTDFAIEENHFTKAQGVPNGNYVGLRVDNTKASDELYKNKFINLSYAIYSEGLNWEPPLDYSQGLEFICNEFSDNFNDIYVTKDEYGKGGVQQIQGTPEVPAGNKFSTQGANYHFYNNSTHLTGYCYSICSSCSNEYPDPIYDIYRWGFDTENGCLSHYGIPPINPKNVVLNSEQKTQTEQEFYSALTGYNNIKALYDNLKDGGNTDALIADVETSWPNDMWELRAKLLGDSPHLSMDVLKTAADKTDVLPNSILFEIMAANPDELKKEELLKYLEDKENPLPVYMIDVLQQVALGTTYKTVLQQQMAYHGRAKTRAAHDMIRSIVNDTMSDLPGLRNWLDNLGGIRADHQIIDTYLAEENSSDALALANMLPTLYKLEGNELDEHDFYMDMLNLQINLNVQGRNLFELDSTEVSNLVYIAESSKGVGGTQARGILELTHGYAYCSCLNETDTSGTKSSGIINPDMLAKVYGFDISAEPNPASEWVAFNYTLPGMEAEAVIKISDVSGKQVATLSIEGKRGQKVWDTRNIKPGIYFYTLNVAGQHKSGKIVISK